MDAEPVQLTESALGVLEYAVSEDGALIVYVTNHVDGGTALHLLDMISKDDQELLVCGAENPCSEPSLSPDEAWLAFAREEFEMGARQRKYQR